MCFELHDVLDFVSTSFVDVRKAPRNHPNPEISQTMASTIEVLANRHTHIARVNGVSVAIHAGSQVSGGLPKIPHTRTKATGNQINHSTALARVLTLYLELFTMVFKDGVT